jgi:hypothetical protein
MVKRGAGGGAMGSRRKRKRKRARARKKESSWLGSPTSGYGRFSEQNQQKFVRTQFVVRGVIWSSPKENNIQKQELSGSRRNADNNYTVLGIVQSRVSSHRQECSHPNYITILEKLSLCLIMVKG